MESGAHMYNKERDIVSKDESILLGKRIAKEQNCSESDDWLQCLRGLDAKVFSKYGVDINDVDIMAGIASTEGSLLSHPYVKNMLTLNNFIESTKTSDSVYHGLDVKRVDDYYLQNVDKNSSLELKKAFYELFGDLMMKCPTYLFAKQMATDAQPGHNVYFYQVTYQNKYFAHLEGCNGEGMGVCHCAELAFVYGFPYLIPDAYSDIDAIFSADLMKMWTNFAKYGKPTVSEEWPQLLSGNTINVKNLNPNPKPNVFINPYDTTCDGLWK
ncbi:unnamed protein product, partial [Medioppia subpectinata]